MTTEVARNMRALFARGREAWPDVVLDFATFSTLACRLGDGPFDDLRADELYLAFGCVAGIERAIAALDAHYLSGLTATLIRRGHDPATAADVVQSLRVRFLVAQPGREPELAKYDGRGSLAVWLRVTAVRRASNSYRKHHREIATESIDVATATHSVELDLLRRRLGVEFRAAFRTAFESLTPRQRTLLRYQVLDRVGIDRIAAIYGVHRATAARWVAYARDALIAGVRGALGDQLHVSPGELDSLFRVIGSKVELSLQLFLTPNVIR